MIKRDHWQRIEDLKWKVKDVKRRESLWMKEILRRSAVRDAQERKKSYKRHNQHDEIWNWREHDDWEKSCFCFSLEKKKRLDRHWLRAKKLSVRNQKLWLWRECKSVVVWIDSHDAETGVD